MHKMKLTYTVYQQKHEKKYLISPLVYLMGYMVRLMLGNALENLSKKDKSILEEKVGDSDSMAQSLKDIAFLSDQEGKIKKKL